MKRFSRFIVIQRKRKQNNVMSIELESIRRLLRTINKQFRYRTGGRLKERIMGTARPQRAYTQHAVIVYNVHSAIDRSYRSFIRPNPDDPILSKRT